ncbi:hypothetical protein [Methanoregula sp.]|jgi:hypothetical protein|uniref:hypothetical protein n=1 Tax=Methanoregula sp. TaxID=2052170 RepID=UPI003C25D56D
MRYLLATVAGCMLLFYVLFAGCTSPTQAQIQPVGTTVPTPAPETTVTVISTTITTLEPISPLPANQAIYLSLTKDRPTGKITLLCNGGPGLIVTQSIEMKVTRADGSVVDQFMNNGGEITSGSEIVVPGTLDGTDHAVIWVTSAGKIYKVIDQDISSLNPYS